MIPNPFDQASRYAARQLDEAGFINWLFLASLRQWRWKGWLETESIPFPGEPERRCDTVAVFERIAGGAPPVAAVIEFQTRPQGDMLERVAEYALRVRREKPYQRDPLVRYDVIGVVLNLTGPPQAQEWSMAPPDFGGAGLHVKVRVLTLREVDAGAVLAAVAAGQVSWAMLAWVPLMRGGGDPAVIGEWRRLAGQVANPRRRGDLGGLAEVFAELAGCLEVWRTGLEGWDVEVSQVVLEWQEKARLAGRAEASRENLLQLVQAKFPGESLADIEAAVAAQKDLAVLGRWFKAALAAKTLAEVRAAFGLP
jgi:hypothetical protein